MERETASRQPRPKLGALGNRQFLLPEAKHQFHKFVTGYRLLVEIRQGCRLRRIERHVRQLIPARNAVAHLMHALRRFIQRKHAGYVPQLLSVRQLRGNLRRLARRKHRRDGWEGKRAKSPPLRTEPERNEDVLILPRLPAVQNLTLAEGQAPALQGTANPL